MGTAPEHFFAGTSLLGDSLLVFRPSPLVLVRERKRAPRCSGRWRHECRAHSEHLSLQTAASCCGKQVAFEMSEELEDMGEPITFNPQ